MSTPNFCEMNFDMPMICLGMNDDMERLARGMFDIEEDEEVGIYDYYEATSIFFDSVKGILEKLNDTLKFHTVSIEDGHYEGYQLWVDETHSNLFDLDKNSLDCISNDEAQYYFGMCRSDAIRRATSEKRRIGNWLLKIAKKEKYLHHIVCSERFSNGEAIYTIMS